MVCPFCLSTDTRVANSRVNKKTARVWRRRNCSNCGQTFTTNELPNYEQMILIKRNGRKEKFSYPKLLISIWRACEPLKRSQEVSEALAATIIGQLLKLAADTELTAELVGEVTGRALQRYNAGAFVRYASYQGALNSSKELKRALNYHK